MTLSDGIDLVYALMLKAHKNINTKPDYFRPTYNLYYMVIYVAIQDAFNYCKVKSKSKHRSAYKWRNKRSAKQRVEARNWLLESDECKQMWEDISDVDHSIFQKTLLMAFDLFREDCGDLSDWNRYNSRSIDVGRRLKGLSI